MKKSNAKILQKIKNVWLFIKTRVHKVFHVFCLCTKAALCKIKRFIVPKWKIFLSIFITAITYFSYDLLIDADADMYEGTLFTTISGIVGTIMAIEFSLILLVVERISSKYSPKFLHYILRNKIFITTVLYSILVIIFCLLPFKLPTVKKPQIAVSAFVMSLAMFIFSLLEATRLMNLKDGVLEPEVKVIKKWLKKELKKIEAAQTTQSIAIAVYNGKAYNVPDIFLEEFEEKMLPIRDIIIRAISGNNIQEAADGIRAFTEVILSYLRCRQNFINDNDKIMFFVYSEFQNIATTAQKTGYLHLRIHPILIGSLELISKEALKIDVKLIKNISSNHLVSFPVKEICNLCIQNLKYENSSAPSMACSALERIGVFAINNGYVDESASILEELSKISNIIIDSRSSELYFLSTQTNNSIMKLAIAMVGNRKCYNSDYAEHVIYSAISNIITNINKNINTSFSIIDPLEPFMCRLYNMERRKYNLANLACSLVFSVDQAYYANDGLENVKRYIYAGIYRPMIGSLGKTDSYRSEEFLDTIYVSQLALLSVFNKNLRVVLFGKEPSNIANLDKKKVLDVFDEGLGILWSYFMRCDHNGYDHDYVLDVIFSLLVIGIADKDTDTIFLKDAKERITEMYKDYCSKKNTPQDTFFKYCRMLNLFIKNITGRNKNLIVNIPRYKDEIGGIYSHRMGDRSLPFGDDYYEFAVHGDNYSNQQWKILGTYSMPSQDSTYFDNLNKIIWND